MQRNVLLRKELEKISDLKVKNLNADLQKFDKVFLSKISIEVLAKFLSIIIENITKAVNASEIDPKIALDILANFVGDLAQRREDNERQQVQVDQPVNNSSPDVNNNNNNQATNGDKESNTSQEFSADKNLHAQAFKKIKAPLLYSDLKKYVAKKDKANTHLFDKHKPFIFQTIGLVEFSRQERLEVAKKMMHYLESNNVNAKEFFTPKDFAILYSKSSDLSTYMEKHEESLEETDKSVFQAKLDEWLIDKWLISNSERKNDMANFFGQGQTGF